MEYCVNKNQLKKEDVQRMELFFDNGDCISIPKQEILEISINLYDKLVVGMDYWGHFSPVIESGFIKLQLQKNVNGDQFYSYVYNQKEYRADRIGYIKNRMLYEGEVRSVKLYDSNGCGFSLYCKIEAIQEGEGLCLKFISPHKMCHYKSDKHTIQLSEIDRRDVSRIDLDFENCEMICIDAEEIVKMQIKLSKELNYDGEGYTRQIEGGYLKIKLDPSRDHNVGKDSFFKIAGGKRGNLQIEKRLCGDGGFDLLDICHLYIEYDFEHCGYYKRECISVNDIRSSEELEAIEKWENVEEQEFMPCFLSGCAEKSDDTLLISFGNTALKNPRCQNEMKKCSVFSIK